VLLLLLAGIIHGLYRLIVFLLPVVIAVGSIIVWIAAGYVAGAVLSIVVLCIFAVSLVAAIVQLASGKSKS
jgi:hypothetical protein